MRLSSSSWCIMLCASQTSCPMLVLVTKSAIQWSDWHYFTWSSSTSSARTTSSRNTGSSVASSMRCTKQESRSKTGRKSDLRMVVLSLSACMPRKTRKSCKSFRRLISRHPLRHRLVPIIALTLMMGQASLVVELPSIKDLKWLKKSKRKCLKTHRRTSEKSKVRSKTSSLS